MATEFDEFEFISNKNNKVNLRPVRMSDLDSLLSYANELIVEDTYVQLSGNPLTEAYEREYLEDAIKRVNEGKKIHYVVFVNEIFAGSCEVRIFSNRKSHVGEIGISLKKPYREEGIGTKCLETLILLSKKANVKLLTLTCFAKNNRAIHTYKKVGFVQAGIIPGMYKYKNVFEDEVIMYLPI